MMSVEELPSIARLERAMKRYRALVQRGREDRFYRSIGSRRPTSWYFLEGGVAYPAKAIWAKANGIRAVQTHTNRAKAGLARMGIGPFVELESNLRPASRPPLELNGLDRASARGHGGGESEAHRLLKEAIARDPGLLGLPVGTPAGRTEQPLPSGDRVDVIFETRKALVLVEVKPRSAPEWDLNRGLFQCIKYRAVGQALSDLEGGHNVRVVLAIGGRLAGEVRARQRLLKIELVEGVAVPPDRKKVQKKGQS